MNPFAKTYIDQLNALAGELGATLREYERRLGESQSNREALVKESWRMTRKIKALQETLERMPALEQENKELRNKNHKSVEHAKRILTLSKTLSEALRP